ncbi:LisH domain-containing protein armc9 [Bulinus truncatus]|nr:LisH domain-containing protein armc9 [Bulinus truncatus]
MSGDASLISYEGELNSIVKEYLDFSGFDKTKTTFETECKEKNKPLLEQNSNPYGSEKLHLTQTQMLEFFHEGKNDMFFNLWRSSMPPVEKDSDSVFQKLEFYLNIYFAVYPFKYNLSQKDKDEAMSNFKKYIESRGASLSQTTEFLPFYALPFVQNPKSHPSYKELFSENWSKDLKSRLERYFSSTLTATPQPKLFELYNGKDGKGLRQQNLLLSQQVLEAEKKASAYLKRHSKVQSDYHNLIGITADLVDALESTVQGKHITPEYLQHLCNRLFTSHMHSSVDLTRPGTAGEALRASVIPSLLPLNDQGESYPSLDYIQLKNQIRESVDHKKALIFQALRWRLTRTSGAKRDQILNAYIQNDILGCSNPGPYRETIMDLLKNSSDAVKQYLARFYNACASLCAGRGYLSTNTDLLPALMDILKGDVRDHMAQEMVLGALQKLSLRRQLQSAMIERGVIEWLVDVLEDNDSLSDYTLEYSVALLMNLCLRTAGKKKCSLKSHQTLKVLSDLLGHDNTEIRPYVNGALYSILAIPAIREEAKAMGMEEILKCFLKENQPDMNRQIEFIIKQLNSNENGEEYDSDEEDEDEDEEEDQEMLETDLDKDEILRPQQGELSGENLLRQFSVIQPPNTASRRKKPTDEPLQRPATPGNRRANDNMNRNINNVAQNFRKNTSTENLQFGIESNMARPPTRSGSRPASQETSHNVDVRPSTQNRALRPSTKAIEKIGPSANLNEYKTAFGAKPKIPRTPEAGSLPGRSTSHGSIKDLPPQPQYSESGPRPSSAGKSSAQVFNKNVIMSYLFKYTNCTVIETNANNLVHQEKKKESLLIK